MPRLPADEHVLYHERRLRLLVVPHLPRRAEELRAEATLAAAPGALHVEDKMREEKHVYEKNIQVLD